MAAPALSADVFFDLSLAAKVSPPGGGADGLLRPATTQSLEFQQARCNAGGRAGVLA